MGTKVVGKIKEKELLGILRYKWKDNTKVDLK
jgi:hypothetical protein